MSSVVLPVSSVSPARVSAGLPLGPLTSRLVLFALAQAGIAAGLALVGHETPWRASAGWWPVSALLANLASIAWIWRTLRAEGARVRDFFHVDGSALGKDALVFVGVMLVAAPISYLPNLGFATLLFGGMEGALEHFVQPIPRWAALVGLVGFPLTVAYAELPTYFAVAMPRLERAGWKGPWVFLVPALFLAAQHVTLPLVFDLRFVAWRLLMFVPFAIYVGAVLRWRPRMLPWLMVAHGLIDVSAAALVYSASV